MMQKKHVLLCGLFAGSLLLAACGTTSSKMAYQPKSAPAIKASAESSSSPVPQPVLHVGQMWAYRRTDLWRHEVVERYEQELRIQDGDRWTVQWRITETTDPLRRGSVTGEYLDARTLAFADPKMTGRHIPLSFPLAPGKTWSFKYSYNPQHSRDVFVEQTASVVGWEEVSVPAGRFRALKVVHDGTYRAIDSAFPWSGTIQEIYWYAPEARRVVKMEYRDTKGDGSPYDQWRDELVSMRLDPGGALTAVSAPSAKAAR